MSSICVRILHENFHINGFAFSLALKLRLRAIRKWPGQKVYHQSYFNSYVEPFIFHPWTWSWFLYLFVCFFFPSKPRSQVWINHIETGFQSKKSANLKNVHPNGLFWSIIFLALQLLKRQKKVTTKKQCLYVSIDTTENLLQKFITDLKKFSSFSCCSCSILWCLSSQSTWHSQKAILLILSPSNSLNWEKERKLKSFDKRTGV